MLNRQREVLVDDVELLARFRAGTLEGFPHGDHLRVMRLLLAELPFDEAADEMLRGIDLLAPGRGHHTRTIAWARLVQDGRPDLQRRDLLDDFYTAERLESGRDRFVAPDRRPLPARFGTLRTERTTLRPMTMDDVDDVHAYQSDPEVCRYQLFEPRSRQEVARRISDALTASRLADPGDDLDAAIDLDGRVIGHIYLKLVSVDDAAGELGWSLHRDFQGRGFATETASAALDYAFGTLGLHRVKAELDPRNTASVALCQRLGMREEALFREDMWFKGGWADTGVYAVLDREWAARDR